MTSDKNNNNHPNKPVIDFPCDFPIKIVSKANFDLEDFAINIVHKHSPKMEYIPASTNTSSKGNYQAVTIVIKAENQDQLDAIYKELTANENIIMVL